MPVDKEVENVKKIIKRVSYIVKQSDEYKEFLEKCTNKEIYTEKEYCSSEYRELYSEISKDFVSQNTYSGDIIEKALYSRVSYRKEIVHKLEDKYIDSYDQSVSKVKKK